MKKVMQFLAVASFGATMGTLVAYVATGGVGYFGLAAIFGVACVLLSLGGKR